MSKKQTVAELSAEYEISRSMVKRHLRGVVKVWHQPPLAGAGFVHLDATYWGRNQGVMVALDAKSGSPLYVSFISHERMQDYKDAVSSIEKRGYSIKELVIDGIQSLFCEFSTYHIQMCQFHMKEIIKRYLTKNPKLKTARSLKILTDGLARMEKREFVSEYDNWKEVWKNILNRCSILKSGKTQFTRRRLRSAMHSIDFIHHTYLFTNSWDVPECLTRTTNRGYVYGFEEEP
jgi:hypothetical protein